MRNLAVLDLGACPYEEAYSRQRALVTQKLEHPESPDILIWVEHPDVYTFGRKKTPEAGVAGKSNFFIERGGEATFHNPGQLVVYPILKLDSKERDLHRYLRDLESTLCLVLKDFGIEGVGKTDATGVWVEKGGKKIASIGVAVKSWVTYHGVALNVSNDLRGFEKIAPCGFPSTIMTSMQEMLGAAPDLESVRKSFLQHFCMRFERVIIRG